MKIGFTGQEVVRMQNRLIELKLLPLGSADGDFGEKTDKAIRQLQSDNGLDPDGIVGALTLRKLYPSSAKPGVDFTKLHMTRRIIPNGHFTWADATRSGQRMPPTEDVYNGMIRIATEAQKVLELIKYPMVITSWYRTPAANAAAGGSVDSRHLYGDAIDFYCDEMLGNEIYRLLDPWWTGGLGKYTNSPYLIHIDARDYQARWEQ